MIAVILIAVNVAIAIAIGDSGFAFLNWLTAGYVAGSAMTARMWRADQ